MRGNAASGVTSISSGSMSVMVPLVNPVRAPTFHTSSSATGAAEPSIRPSSSVVPSARLILRIFGA